MEEAVWVVRRQRIGNRRISQQKDGQDVSNGKSQKKETQCCTSLSLCFLVSTADSEDHRQGEDEEKGIGRDLNVSFDDAVK